MQTHTDGNKRTVRHRKRCKQYETETNGHAHTERYRYIQVETAALQDIGRNAPYDIRTSTDKYRQRQIETETNGL